VKEGHFYPYITREGDRPQHRTKWGPFDRMTVMVRTDILSILFDENERVYSYST